MNEVQERLSIFGIFYRQIFRLIFAVFFLYLMGDAIYRWSGFRYYATFSEFLPAVALATILWGIVAVFISVLVWLIFEIIKRLCQKIGLKIEFEHLWLFTGIFILLLVVVYFGRGLVFSSWAVFRSYLDVLFIAVTLTSIFITWLFRHRAEKYMDGLQERITPLLFLFTAWIIIAVPLLVYHTWVKEAGISGNANSEVTSVFSKENKDTPNILLVTFDALTSRNMSLYGYQRPTTPFINKWAETASVFTRFYAESNSTGATTATLMTGKRMTTHQRFHVHGKSPLKSDIENLPLLMKKHGYYNIGFMANPVASVSSLGMENSFDFAPKSHEFYIPTSLVEWLEKYLESQFGDKILLYDWVIKGDFVLYKVMGMFSRSVKTFSRPPEIVFSKFLSNLEKNFPTPYFAWIHLLPPHDPYLPPEPFMGMFNDTSEFRTWDAQTKKSNHEVSEKYEDRIYILRDRYDEYIRFCDEQFKDFIVKLTEKDLLDNTIIILSSDHGEIFREKCCLGHSGPNLFDPLVHIPLVVKKSSQTEGLIINDLTEQVDLPATILGLANIPLPSWMEGRSLVPLINGEEIPSRPIFSYDFEGSSSLGQPLSSGTIAVWEDDYKLIHYLQRNKSLLFNLADDPNESDNLFDKEPEIAQHLLTLVQENLKKANERIMDSSLNK